jgi:hypothetical protein
MATLVDGSYYVMDSDHLDGPFSLVEGIAFLLELAENPSPEMEGIVLVKFEKYLKLCKANSFPLNVGFFKWHTVDSEEWVKNNEVIAN